MNVLVAALSAPAQLNGVSRHASNLARALLSTRGVSEVHFVAGEWQKDMFRKAMRSPDSRLHMHWMPLKDANVSRLLWYRRDLALIAEQLEADIVHFTYPAPLAPSAFHCPTVLSLHDVYAFEIPQNFGYWRSALARWTMAACIERVDAIACVSAATRERLANWFPAQAGKAGVIPNVVEVQPARMKLGISGLHASHRFVLCIAQHRRNKNLPLALKVFERLIGKRILPADARLVIVGIPGPETNRILMLIRRLRLHGRVVLCSGLADAELQWCYQNCELLLAPSITEGFGLPVVEAMLAGCRVVCSDIAAFREVGRDGCRFVPWQGDLTEAYANAISELMAAPRPQAASFPQFSCATVGARYLDLYRSLLCSPISEFGMLRQLETAATPVNSGQSVGFDKCHEIVISGGNPNG